MKISSVYKVPYINRYVEQPKQYKKPQAPVYNSLAKMYEALEGQSTIVSRMVIEWAKATSKRDKKRLANYLRKEFNFNVNEVA
jgi:hypothetical protein